jgi:hypothetical protein
VQHGFLANLAKSRLTLSQTAKAFGPGPREGRPTSPSTVYRWIVKGVKVPGGGRVRLQAQRVGGSWMVTTEAIDEFVRVLTEAHKPDGESPAPRSVGRRQEAADRAGEHLEKLGA